VAAIQQETRQADITNRIVLQKMKTENRLIKNLIVSLGFSSESVKRYLQLANRNTVVDCKVAIPAAIGRPVETPSVASCQSPCSMPSSQVTAGVSAGGKVFVKQPLLHDYAYPTNTISTQQFTEEQQMSPISPSCKENTIDQQASEFQPDQKNTLNTTLCVDAEELLDQHNAKGIHECGLRRRICPGGEETDLDCCRVQNDVLFQVLDDISNITLH
jgi:hypothetical protein